MRVINIININIVYYIDHSKLVCRVYEKATRIAILEVSGKVFTVVMDFSP